MKNFFKSRFQNGSILWCTILGAYFFLFYAYANYFTSLRSEIPFYFFDWEKKIPFIPWMINPYMSSDIIFIVAFLALKQKEHVHTIAKRIGFIISFSVICYLLFPLKFSFVKPDTTTSIFHFWFQLLSADLPYNQCPSLHISQALIFWIVFYNAFKNFWSRLFTHVWFSLIMLSTLTVYQHHFIDLLGGLSTGLLALVLFPYRQNTLHHNYRFASFYYLIASCFFAFIFFASSFWNLIPLYFSLSFFLVGLMYQLNAPHFICKKNRKIKIWALLCFSPYLIINKLSWIYFSREKNAYIEVLPKLYFGRRLKTTDTLPSDAQRLVVVDLAPEIEEVAQLNQCEYCYFPFVDMAYPSIERLKKAARLIEKQLIDGKHVYIHCRLGMTRSALVACAYLILVQKHPPNEAIKKISRLRKINFPANTASVLYLLSE